jgi:hypothetical protein
MARPLIILLACLAALGCGATVSTPTETPDAFMKRLLALDYHGRWPQSWELLHPGHQRFVSRARFARCNSTTPNAGVLASVKTLQVYDDGLDIVGIPQHSSKAVSVRLTVRSGTATQSLTATAHVVWTGERWAWVLPASDALAYKAGRCP